MYKIIPMSLSNGAWKVIMKYTKFITIYRLSQTNITPFRILFTEHPIVVKLVPVTMDILAMDTVTMDTVTMDTADVPLGGELRSLSDERLCNVGNNSGVGDKLGGGGELGGNSSGRGKLLK